MKLFSNNDVADVIKAIELETGCKVKSYKATKTEFNDGSLGLARPGEGYIQCITPGYILKLKMECDGKEVKKTYHSNLEGSILKEKI